MVQGRFIVGTSHRSKPMQDRSKNSWPHQYSFNGVPRAPSNEFSPAKQVKDWGGPPLKLRVYQSQPSSTNARPPWSGSTSQTAPKDWMLLDCCLPQGKIWRKVFYRGGFSRERSHTQAKTCMLLVNAGHRFTKDNVIVKSPGTNAGNLAGDRLTRPKGPMQCESMLVTVKFPGMKAGNPAGDRLTRPKGPVQCESMLVIVKSPGTNDRKPSARQEQPKAVYIYICLPPGRIWHKVFFYSGGLGQGEDRHKLRLTCCR